MERQTCSGRSIPQTNPSAHEDEFFYSSQQIGVRAHEESYIGHRATRYDGDLGPSTFVPCTLDMGNHTFQSPDGRSVTMFCEPRNHRRVSGVWKALYAPQTVFAMNLWLVRGRKDQRLRCSRIHTYMFWSSKPLQATSCIQRCAVAISIAVGLKDVQSIKLLQFMQIVFTVDTPNRRVFMQCIASRMATASSCPFKIRE